jgi:anti-sigma factor RsiW
MDCQEFWEIADSYLSDELTIESNHEAIAHIEKCAKCRSELAARRAVRTKLREAFRGLPSNRMRPKFMDDMSRRLQDAAIGKRSGRLRRYSMLAVAAGLLLAAVLGVIIVRQQLSRPARTTAKADRTNSSDQQELAKAAVGDHRDCAVQFRLAEKPIDLELAGRQYDAAYLGLTKSIFIAGGETPLGVQLIEAHSCIFKGRRFAHLVLKYRGSLLSVLVTEIPAARVVRSAPSSVLTEPDSIVCSQIDDYNVSFFQTARHAVFVVSALPEGENLAVTRALAPGIFVHLRDSEERG